MSDVNPEVVFDVVSLWYSLSLVASELLFTLVKAPDIADDGVEETVAFFIIPFRVL